MSILSTLMGGLQGSSGASPSGTSATSGSSLSGLAAGSAGALVISQVVSLIQSRPGGLGGLLQSFQQGGLGQVVQSWIGNGQNMPVSAEQLHGTLGSDTIGRIAQATGLSQEQIEQHLSALLPLIVDHLTPNGQVPQGTDLSNALGALVQRSLHA